MRAQAENIIPLQNELHRFLVHKMIEGGGVCMTEGTV